MTGRKGRKIEKVTEGQAVREGEGRNVIKKEEEVGEKEGP